MASARAVAIRPGGAALDDDAPRLHHGLPHMRFLAADILEYGIEIGARLLRSYVKDAKQPVAGRPDGQRRAERTGGGPSPPRARLTDRRRPC